MQVNDGMATMCYDAFYESLVHHTGKIFLKSPCINYSLRLPCV